MEKYELTKETIKDNFGKKLFRIRALVDFADVKKGDLGGFIEKEENLSHYNDSWVYDNAFVCGNSRVFDNARVCGDAKVYDGALIYDSALIYGNARIFDSAQVYGHAKVCGDARVHGNARISSNARIFEDSDYSTVTGFGRCNRTTTFYRCQNGKIRVNCGCFFGDLEKFRSAVKSTHGDGKMAKEYLAIADLMEMHFNT